MVASLIVYIIELKSDEKKWFGLVIIIQALLVLALVMCNSEAKVIQVDERKRIINTA